jgi:hypothetical protein
MRSRTTSYDYFGVDVPDRLTHDGNLSQSSNDRPVPEPRLAYDHIDSVDTTWKVSTRNIGNDQADS